MNTRFRQIAGSTTCLFLLVACGAAGEDTSSETSIVAYQDQPLVFNPSWLWPSPTIPVCWESSTDAFPAEKGWVKNAIETSWEAVSRVDFVGWDRCSFGQTGIRIATDEGLSRSYVGIHDVNGRTNGMHLNFTFNRAYTYCKYSSYERENCIRNHAMHEFGHALGFDHEQNHPDSTCEHDPGDPGSNAYTGPYDRYSIMNYCGPNIPKLSAGDIRGVQALYGARSGMLVGHGSKCLEVPFRHGDNGTEVHTWDCWGGTNQQFRLLSDQLGNRISNVQAGKYIDSPAASVGNGTLLQIWSSPPYQDAQEFKFKRFEIRGIANYCVDVPNAKIENMNRMQLYSCNGTVAQRWDMNNGRIMIGNKCLEPLANWPLANRPIVLNACNDSNTQKWELRPGGAIANVALNWCMETEDKGWGNGTHVNIGPCMGSTSQHWFFRGMLFHADGDRQRCMEVNSYGTQNGSRAGLWQCTGGANQYWDYHP